MIEVRRQKAEGRNAFEVTRHDVADTNAVKSDPRLRGRRKHFCLLPSAFCLSRLQLCVLLSLFLFSAGAFAQTAADRPPQNQPPVPPPASPYAPIQPIPLGDTLLSLPTSHIPGTGTWEVKFTHRFAQSIDQGSFSDRIHSLFGLDSNADVGLGMSYTAHPRLEFSLLRSNVLDDVELAAKIVAVQQAQRIPFSAALRIGGDIRTEKNVTDRTTGFGQVILSHQFGRRAEIFALPTWATNAGRATSGALFRNAFNVPVGGAIMLSPAFSIVGEFLPKNHDVPVPPTPAPPAKAKPQDFGWSFGIKEAVGGHYFEILLTNSNATTVDQYVTTTYQGGGLNRGDLHLGFNIERRFGGGAH